MTETTETDETNEAKPTDATGEPDGAAVRFPPPFVPLITLAVGIALQFPWPLALPLYGLLRYGLGTLLLLVGLGAMGARSGCSARSAKIRSPGSRPRRSFPPGSTASRATLCTSAWV